MSPTRKSANPPVSSRGRCDRGLSTMSPTRSSAGTPNRRRGHCGLLPSTKTTPNRRPSWRGLSACRVPTHRDARPPGPRLLHLSKPPTRRPTCSPNPLRGLSTMSPTRSSASTSNRRRGHCGLLPPTETLDPDPPNPESKQGSGVESRAAKPPLQPLQSPPAPSLAHPDCSRIPLPHRPSVSHPYTFTRAAQPVRLMFINVHRGAS